MGLYPVAVCYNARQDNTIQFRTIEYNTITHVYVLCLPCYTDFKININDLGLSRVCVCVIVCDIEASTVRRPRAELGCYAAKIYNF
jgi:hypothetical protein